ncbi:protein-tyrosine-phosphatase, partial [Salibacteraceae bacterium]|nr:protein-tyrosine-phosphatase [Salibacteraceae bacterium]
RSQLAQIWAQTMAAIYDVEAQCYSGGVEVTEFNSRAVHAIQNQGFEVIREGISNPYFYVCFSNDRPSIQCYSKVFDDQPNGVLPPFAAIMTCAHADENCPVISGAEKRIPIRYEDPKLFDDTDQESEKYTERSLQIAREMMFVFSKIQAAK